MVRPLPLLPARAGGGALEVDIISVLVNIYGSKELFVDEYAVMLGDRLITLTNFDIDKEFEHVELLKLKFGENSMHHCEVMLKDMTNSKRINTYVHNEIKRQQENRGLPHPEQVSPNLAKKLLIVIIPPRP